jgi:hypothetical protein
MPAVSTLPTLSLVATHPVSDPLQQQHSATVLTADLIARLRTLNTTSRVLRSIGYRIAAESLRLDRATPEIRLDRGDQSLVALLDRGHGHTWTTIGDKRIGYTSLNGVIVSWEEA